jgi:hypothetical protein
MTCSILVSNKMREFPTIVNASNYTSLKRDRLLYSQYKLDKLICDKNPTAIYKSYELRRNIKYGCFLIKRVCLKTCLDETSR